MHCIIVCMIDHRLHTFVLEQSEVYYWYISISNYRFVQLKMTVNDSSNFLKMKTMVMFYQVLYPNYTKYFLNFVFRRLLPIPNICSPVNL
jgi:hypothetical protein